MEDSEKLNSEKVAIVTGASRGLGFEFAKLFAEHGYNLIITSDSDEIFKARDQLLDFGVDVEAVRTDLTRSTEVEKLYEVIANSDYFFECIVINAGAGLSGRFVENDLQNELKIVHLNCVSVVHLSKLILPEMINNKTGKILFTTTLPADMPNPFLAVYTASQAFIKSFVESIRFELKDTDVSVAVLQAGSADVSPDEFAKKGFSFFKNVVNSTVTKILPEEHVQ